MCCASRRRCIIGIDRGKKFTVFHLTGEAFKTFLEELKEILNAKEFNVDNDITIVKSSKDEIEYSTQYLMLDLEYDTSDIVERLKKLTIAEYSETLIDKDDDKPPLLFFFVKILVVNLFILN